MGANAYEPTRRAQVKVIIQSLGASARPEGIFQPSRPGPARSNIPEVSNTAQGEGKTDIWKWAREKLDGRPNVWVALGDDFDHKSIRENSALRCGTKTCFQESLRQKKNCKPAITPAKPHGSTSYHGFDVNLCLITLGILGISLILIDLGLNALKNLKFMFKKQLQIALLIPIIIYVAALVVLYKDRFETKRFCGLNPFEPGVGIRPARRFPT